MSTGSYLDSLDDDPDKNLLLEEAQEIDELFAEAYVGLKQELGINLDELPSLSEEGVGRYDIDVEMVEGDQYSYIFSLKQISRGFGYNIVTDANGIMLKHFLSVQKGCPYEKRTMILVSLAGLMPLMFSQGMKIGEVMEIFKQSLERINEA